MLDDVEYLQAGGGLRDLQAPPPSREGRPVRQPAGDHDGPVQTMGVLAMPADLKIQRGVEVPGVIMNLPQGSWMSDDRERRTPSFSRNGRVHWRRHDKL